MNIPYNLPSPLGPGREVLDAIDAVRNHQTWGVNPVRLVELGHYYLSLRCGTMAGICFGLANRALKENTQRLLGANQQTRMSDSATFRQ